MPIDSVGFSHAATFLPIYQIAKLESRGLRGSMRVSVRVSVLWCVLCVCAICVVRERVVQREREDRG